MNTAQRRIHPQTLQPPTRSTARSPWRIPPALMAFGALTTLWLFTAMNALALITFDAASSASSANPFTSVAWSHTVGSGANRMLVVGVGTERNADQYAATVTYGTQSLTRVTGSAATGASAPLDSTELWYLAAPDVGTNTITVTFATSQANGGECGAVSLFGVKQEAPEAVAILTGQAAGSSYSLGITTVTPGAWLVDVVTNGSTGATFTPGASQAERWDRNATGQLATACSTREVLTAGTVTDTWTTNGSSRRAQSIAAFAQADSALGIALTAPTASQAFSVATSITATAVPYGGSSPYTVKFFLKPSAGSFSQVGSDVTSSPYQVSLGALAADTYQIYTSVTDNASGTADSTPAISFTVSDQLPAVAITSPANNATPLYGSTITVSGTATDDVALDHVEIYDGATLLGNATLGSGTFSYAWNGAAVGAHSLTAKAVDSGNQTTTSAAVNLTVVTPILVDSSGSGAITFDTLPPAIQWSTLSVGGGSGDVETDAAMDTAMNLVAASSISTVLTTQAGSGQLANGYWRSGDLKLGTQPTGNKMTLLMASLKNTSGVTLSDVTVSFTLGLASATPGELIKGYRVYWSKTGATGTWTAVANDCLLATPGTSTPVSIELTSLAWANNDPLYVVWSDDNGAAGTDGDYTIDNVSFAPTPMKMLTFGLTGNPATISGTNITLYVPNGTNVTNLGPEFTFSEGSTCTVNGNPAASGDTFNFTSPVHYILQSGIFSNDYTVTVISAPVETAITWNTGSGTWNHTTANWLGQNTGLPTPFYNGQNVIFDKTTGGTITIDPNMEPASVIVSAAAGTYTFTGGPISGAGSLAKSGSGSLILSGSNSYTGATTVTGGILKINGSTSASSAFGVSAGAIGGSGTLNGPVTLSGSGGINLYDGATGTLTLGGSLDITGDAGSNTLWFDLGNNTAATDKIAVTGAVSISNPVTIGLKQLGWPSSRVTAGTYDLLSTTSGTLPAIGNFILPITKTFGQTFSLALDGTSQKLQLTAAQAATGPAAAFWSGATDANWSTATNWNTDATSNITASGAPSYNTNVTFYTTTPAAANLTTTLDADFDINTLTFSTDATSPVTLSGATKTLTLEGSGGITVNTPTSGTVTHTIDSKVALAASQTWTVNPNATLTVSGAVTDLTGSANFTKAGTGTLYLNGATTLGGYMTVGVGAAAGSVVVGSGGSLSVGSGSSQYLYVGVNSGGTGILDASLSSGVNANVGNFYVGTGSSGGTGTLNLGANNTITASALFGVGTALWDSTTGTLTTANSSTTTIHTPTMSIGYGNSGNGTESGTGTITLGTGASFIVDGLVSGNGSGRTTMNIGYDTEQYGRSSSGIVNLSAGTASLTLNSLLVAWQTGNGSTPGTLTFGTSGSNHFDVSGTGNVVQIGYLGLFGGGGSGAGTGTVTLANLDASSAVTSTDNNTAILLGNRVAGASGSTTGTLNLIGGSLTITTGGTAIGTAGSGGASYLNIDGTTLKAGATSTTWIQGLTTAKIKAGGVGFNSNGYNITVAQNLLEDTGSTGGGLTKSGAGTLTLTGSNTYTGLTTVSNGTLALGATASLTTSGVTVAAGAVFNTTAQAPFVIPEALPVTLHLTGADAGSSGRITATELDITHANVTLTLDGDLDDNVYILADYTTLTGTGFLTVTTVTGYSIDYAYNGGTQIALVADIAPGYDIWANTNITLIDGLADATTTGDPDGDGSNNLAEYAFGGDPLSGSDNGKVFSQFKLRELSPNGTELILTVAVLTDTSATFVLDGNTLIGTSIAGGITYRIEGSNDLNFSNVQVGQVTPEPTSAMLNVLPTGYAYRSFVLAPGGTPAKGFLRAVVVKPD